MLPKAITKNPKSLRRAQRSKEEPEAAFSLRGCSVAIVFIENEGLDLSNLSNSLSLSLSLSETLTFFDSYISTFAFRFVSVQHRKPHHWVPEEARNRRRCQTVPLSLSLSLSPSAINFGGIVNLFGSNCIQ